VPENLQGEATLVFVSIATSTTLGALESILVFTAKEHTPSLTRMYAIVTQTQLQSQTSCSMVCFWQSVLCRQDVFVQDAQQFVGAVVAHPMYSAQIHEQHCGCQLA
jgi:hypothetical protein